MNDDNTPHIFILAIVKALSEGHPTDTHFGSTASLSLFLDEAQQLGLITDNNILTDLGRDLAAELCLSALPQGRATMWPNTDTLEARASKFIKIRKDNY